MDRMSTYRPLPYDVTIQNSEIEGLGLFAKSDIEPSRRLGWTHVEFEGHLIRTPLGGFVNHSETPNAFILKQVNFREMIAIRDIKAGEEITLYYTEYKVN
jgi:SET domain-containing protein